MEGLTTCVFARMLACLNHVHGWTIWGGYGTSQTRFLVASDRSQVARRRVRLDLGDLGIIEQQLNQSSDQLGSQAFASSLMHSPVTGLFRVLWIGFFFPPSVPASRATG